MGRDAGAYPATYGQKWAFGGLDTLLKGTSTMLWKCPGTSPHNRTFYVLSAPGLELRTLRCSAQSLLFYFVSFYGIVIFLELHSTVQQRLLEVKDSSLVFSWLITLFFLCQESMNDEKLKKRWREREREEGDYVIV